MQDFQVVEAVAEAVAVVEAVEAEQGGAVLVGHHLLGLHRPHMR
jgi:hypothetical protein